jgi:hypothetical protein
LNIPIQRAEIARAIGICPNDLDLAAAVADTGMDQRGVAAMCTDKSDTRQGNQNDVEHHEPLGEKQFLKHVKSPYKKGWLQQTNNG